MASERLGELMIGQRHIAILATGHPTALAALNTRGETTTILEKNGLLACRQSLPDRRQQTGREGAAHQFATAQILDIHHFHTGQAHALITSG